MSMELSDKADRSMDTTNYSILTKDLNLWYGKFQALYDVNVAIKNGRITSLIGPSGCGKTTLLSMFSN